MKLYEFKKDELACLENLRGYGNPEKNGLGGHGCFRGVAGSCYSGNLYVGKSLLDDSGICHLGQPPGFFRRETGMGGRERGLLLPGLPEQGNRDLFSAGRLCHVVC